MNRVWDYIVFAVWFAGLGYIVVWLGGSPFHLMLPPALHAVGVVAATLVPVRLLVRAVGRRRPAPGVRRRASCGAQTRAPLLRPSHGYRKSSHSRFARLNRAAILACAACRVKRGYGISSALPAINAGYARSLRVAT
jgi:hypothetical protein